MTIYLIAAALFVAVVCRARHMDDSTPLISRLQHWLPLALTVASLPQFETHRWAHELSALALLVFVLLERRRAPAGWRLFNHG